MHIERRLHHSDHKRRYNKDALQQQQQQQQQVQPQRPQEGIHQNHDNAQPIRGDKSGARPQAIQRMQGTTQRGRMPRLHTQVATARPQAQTTGHMREQNVAKHS